MGLDVCIGEFTCYCEALRCTQPITLPLSFISASSIELLQAFSNLGGVSRCELEQPNCHSASAYLVALAVNFNFALYQLFSLPQT